MPSVLPRIFHNRSLQESHSTGRILFLSDISISTSQIPHAESQLFFFNIRITFSLLPSTNGGNGELPHGSVVEDGSAVG